MLSSTLWSAFYSKQFKNKIERAFVTLIMWLFSRWTRSYFSWRPLIAGRRARRQGGAANRCHGFQHLVSRFVKIPWNVFLHSVPTNLETENTFPSDFGIGSYVSIAYCCILTTATEESWPRQLPTSSKDRTIKKSLVRSSFRSNFSLILPTLR